MEHKRITPYVSFYMALLLLLSVFVTGQPPTAYAASDPVNGFSNPCGYNPATDGQIPAGIRPCNDNGFKFNSGFYYDKLGSASGPENLIVYGKPADLGSKNEFKKGWEINGVVNTSKGHFNKNGVMGEWRYLGFTQDGGVYTNYFFIKDADSGTNLEDKHWVKTPWDSLPSSYIAQRGPQSPGYIYQNALGGYDNVTDTKFDYLLQNMQRSMNFTITQGVDYANRYDVLPYSANNSDPRNYMAVNQAPTAREPGYGTLYHFSWISNSMWYQTFPLLQLAPPEKTTTPVACSVKVADAQPIAIGKEKKVKVRVTVIGTLQDDSYYGNYQNEIKHYTRKDIDRWRLDLWDETKGAYLNLSTDDTSDKVVEDGNTASGTFVLTIDTDKLDKSNPALWKYTTNAGTFAFFANHKAWDPSYTSQYCNLSVNFKPGPATMKSQFSVNPSFEFENPSQFTTDEVAYRDESYGKDVDYYQFEISNTEDGTKITKTVNPAIPEVKAPAAGALDQAEINQWLYDFMKSKFPDSSVTAKRTQHFVITQTIVDKDTTVNNKSAYTQNVMLTQQPPGDSPAFSPPPGGCEGPLGNGNSVMQGPPPPQYIQPETDFPRDWYDVAPFPVTDAPPKGEVPHAYCDAPASYDQFSKAVTIDGSPIDATTFFAGKYVFGTDKLGLHQVKVTFTAPDGTVSFLNYGVVIHESKPRVSMKFDGLWKQNRTMTATDTSASSNDAWVESHSPLQVTSFSYVNPTDPNLVTKAGYGEGNLSQKIYMYKQPGHYEMSITATRTLKGLDGSILKDNSGNPITLTSDPYLVQYEILPDEKPAIIAHSYVSQVSRLDAINLKYDVVSVDGDKIANKTLTVFYDSDNDGTFDQQVFQSTGDLTQLPVFNKLGQYQYVVNAKEGTDQDRLMEYITAADDQTNTFTGYFFVDNFEPSSDLYLDVPNQKPDMDAFFMLDANLNQSETDYVNGSRVTITNMFTSGNMLANVGIWDMKTYTYTTPGSTSINTGGSYPSSTTYYSSNGYAGTIPLSSVSNAPYSRDEGNYVSQTDSKTATDSCPHTISGTYTSSNPKATTGTFSKNYDSGDCPGSMSYSDGQYSGTLSRTGETGAGCAYTGPVGSSCTANFTASYAGTVYWTHNVWVPKMVSYNDYTGYYSGTLYKDVRAPYDASFLRPVPTKYLIYISDNTVSQLADLQKAMNENTFKLICVGQSAMTSQIACDKFILNNKPIDQLVSDVINYIAQSNPAIPKVFKLAGEGIETHTATFDFEGDPIPSANDQLQIIQDPYYFDNSQGFDSFAGLTISSTKSAGNWRQYLSMVTLNKPGKYTFYRRVQDQPTTDPRFASYNYWSNESAIEVYVHRKPIADVTLDFDFDTNSGTYRTTWVDKSYDLDHNVTRASTDRGIQARTIKFTNTGTGQVFTKIPTSLPPGTYKLDYAAQDIEGVWSDPVVRTFDLPGIVPVQFKSNLKATASSFSLGSIPASEQLTAFNLWTRYPYSISLWLAMTPSGNYINQTVPYYTGTKSGNDINWNDVAMTIPATTPDGTYTFRIQANGSANGSTAYNDYSVNVFTPINLNPTSPTANQLLVVGYPATLTATTTKYPSTTTATLFYGTGYAQTVSLSATNNGSGKTWNWSTSSFANVPDGNYTVRFISTNPSGKSETKDVPIRVTHNTPPFGDFKSYTYDSNNTAMPIFEGDTVHLDPVGVGDNEHDTLDVNYTVKDPSGTVVLNQNLVYNYPYPTSGGPTLVVSKVGTYTVTLTLSDRKAAPVVITHTFNVNALGIAGTVSHTAQWETNRVNYNLANPTTPRTADTFWAGEQFILASSVTNTGSSWDKANSITVTLLEKSVTVNLTNTSGLNWGGSMWQSDFDTLPDGTYNFRFSVKYSNGVVKTTTVPVRIKDSIWDVTKTHRTE